MIGVGLALGGCGSGSGASSSASSGSAEKSSSNETNYATYRYCQNVGHGRWATNNDNGLPFRPCTPQAGSPNTGEGDIEPNCKYFPPCPTSRTKANTSAQQAAPPTTPPLPKLKGLGATPVDFNANHTPQSAALNSVGVNGVDTINTASGRVIGFVLEFNAKPPLSIAEAESEARSELPTDAHLQLARRPGSTCAQEFYESATLRRVTGGGVALIEFESGQPGDPYDASAVASATFTNLASVDRSIPC